MAIQRCYENNDDGGHLVKAGQAPFVEKFYIGKCLRRKARSTKSDDPKTSGIACDVSDISEIPMQQRQHINSTPGSKIFQLKSNSK